MMSFMGHSVPCKDTPDQFLSFVQAQDDSRGVLRLLLNRSFDHQLVPAGAFYF